MRVFDFDGTIYDGESLFDLYMFSARTSSGTGIWTASSRGMSRVRMT